MRACTLYAAKDLRVVQEPEPEADLAANEVSIRSRMGGICGSDLHYYHEGRVGNFAVQQPLTLGHEVSGEVIEVGAAVTRVRVGQRVAVNPSLPCNACDFCLQGSSNHCRNMRFFGSAALMPHVQGVFKDYLKVPESQCVAVPDTMPFELAAMGEPLAVALHAVQQGAPVTGRRVLITGAGPIGCLVLLAARHAGASQICVTDLADPPLQTAIGLGADEAINVARDTATLERYGSDKGYFDTVIECSGSIKALEASVDAVRAGGTIVQVGFPPVGNQPFPINRLLAKEINYKGSFRFHQEFEWAIDFLAKERIDVSPLLTGTYKIDDAVSAFEAATDRNIHMKVHIEF
jgi:L-idonate 5-dehydrogenase